MRFRAASLRLCCRPWTRALAAECGRLPGTRTFRNLARHPQAVREEGVIVFRIGAGLSFANALYRRDRRTPENRGSREVRSLVTGR